MAPQALNVAIPLTCVYRLCLETADAEQHSLRACMTVLQAVDVLDTPALDFTAAEARGACVTKHDLSRHLQDRFGQA